MATEDLRQLILDLGERMDRSEEKRSRRSKPAHVYRRKGNKAQAEFNEDICDRLYKLYDYIKSGSVRRSKNLVSDLISDVEKRIKCIRLADKSLAGWATVDEYLPDELASDSEDDRRIQRAEKRALEKMKKSVRPKPTPPLADRAPTTTPLPVHKPVPTSSSGRPDRRSQSNNFRCFRCGRYGHLRSKCYAKTNVYPSTNQQGTRYA